jgi:hypothetical protein
MVNIGDLNDTNGQEKGSTDNIGDFNDINGQEKGSTDNIGDFNDINGSGDVSVAYSTSSNEVDKKDSG